MYPISDTATSQRPDMDIEADARQVISQLDGANSVGLDVDVSVLEGQVTLSGYMRSEMIGPGIEQAVRAVPGTRRVLNHLFDDSSLVRRLATALAVDPRTRAISPGYQVVSALGHTMVVGNFTNEAEAAVRQVCAGVAGVRSVLIRSYRQ
jgi:hypothetical protein